MVTRFADDTFRQKLHKDTHTKFESLLEDLEEADRILDEGISPRRLREDAFKLSLTPKDIEGLPEEVLKELSISEGDKAEFAILEILEEAGGILSLDQIIVNLWRKTEEAHKRPALISRLYRMAGLFQPADPRG
jgi:hypothetical protein